MKARTCIYLFFLTFISADAQPGFSHQFDFGTQAYFNNILLNGDTLIISGAVLDANVQKVAALFVKMDTLGNIYDYSKYTDTLGSHLSFQKGYPFIRSFDGGYLAMGDVLEREADFLIKYDKGGEPIFFWEFEYPPQVWTRLPFGLIETQSGYFIFFTTQINNGFLDITVMKVDKGGEKLWEISHGEVDINDSVWSVWQEDENTIVIGASKTGPQSWIFAIDSLGNMKWEWTGPEEEESAVRGIQKDMDGNWVYSTSAVVEFDQWNWGSAPKIVKRDADFNLIWERQVGETYWVSNRMHGIMPTPEGNWIGAGTWIQPEPFYAWSTDYVYTPGCLFKVSNEGDSLWVRCDSTEWINGFDVQYHEYGGLVVLPSGSTVAVGSFEQSTGGQGFKSWAWVVKVDRDGCLEELCTVTGVEDLVLNEKEYFDLYPNPVNDFIRLNLQDNNCHIRLFNTGGQLIESWQSLSGEVVLDVKGIPKGLYFMDITSRKYREVKKVIFE